MSAPPTKARVPAPRSTTARKVASVRSAAAAAISSCATARLIAFSLAGPVDGDGRHATGSRLVVTTGSVIADSLCVATPVSSAGRWRRGRDWRMDAAGRVPVTICPPQAPLPQCGASGERRIWLCIADRAVALLGLLAVGMPQRAAWAQGAKHYSFGYDQPHTTGYGIAADIFGAKLLELSNGTMAIDQFPGAQLGQEPQMLQKIRTGDIDFMISATANAATLSPQSGVLSIHLHVPLGGSPDQAPSPTPALVEGGARDVRRHGEGRACADADHAGPAQPVRQEGDPQRRDIKGLKVRVQATPTEDTMFPAYGAQTVHMPFGSVYTSLQTGVDRHGRERHQRLPRQQALRGRAGDVADRSTRRTTT